MLDAAGRQLSYVRRHPYDVPGNTGGTDHWDLGLVGGVAAKLRFSFSSGNGWCIQSLSLSGYGLDGPQTFWMDSPCSGSYGLGPCLGREVEWQIIHSPPPPPPSPPSPPPPPDYTGTIVGISIGAIALILFIGVSGCIVARRTAPVRAVWARKRALREPLVGCGLTRHLQQAGVCDDEQVLERAAAWVRANKPGSVEDIIRFGLAQSFVNSLNLPPIPQQKLLATFGGRPQHEMPVEVQAMPVSMPVVTEAVAMGTAVGMETEPGGGGSWFSGSAGGCSSSSLSSNQPTLSEAVAILKRELGLEGNVADVVKQAAFQLGVDGSLPLVEMARQCVQNLGVEGECA